MRALLGWALASFAVGLSAVAGCSMKTEASDKICQPSQKIRCNDHIFLETPTKWVGTPNGDNDDVSCPHAK